MRNGIIVAVAVLCASSSSGQTNILGAWTCVETNHHLARYSNYTYVVTTHFHFMTNGTITVTKNTPDILHRPHVTNTKHVGTYAIDGNRLMITADEVSGYCGGSPALNESYLFAMEGRSLIMTNAVKGSIRHLTRISETNSPNNH